MGTLRKQYYFRPSKNGYAAWDVDKLILLSKDLAVQQVPISTIKELDEPHWYGGEGDVATCRSIVAHIRLIQEADLSYPIILSAEGRVMDGMHRVSKASLQEQQTIAAVQFAETPKPDYIDVYPDDLPYD